MQHGLLLINIGTPSSTSVSSVWMYLRQFLTDKRVIDLPVLIRYLLVNCFIAPLRSRQSAHAYRAIWTEDGSPLLQNGIKLCDKLQAELGSKFTVALGMHYGQPSIDYAFKKLAHCTSITVLPLYPQYSSAATGAAIDKVGQSLATMNNVPSLHIIRDFYQDLSFIKAQANIIKPYVTAEDYLLFSYHGLPERQIIKSGCETVCTSKCPNPNEKNASCYRAQCFHTSALLAKELGINSEKYDTAFQSRLGTIPWIKPYTDQMLSDLAAKGIKNLVIACPSFVADCLETLEEIGIRAKHKWISLGGERFTLVPCLNDDPNWVTAITKIIQLSN